MTDQLQLGYEFARGLGEQLISLSTAIVALSATFTKDIVKRIPPKRAHLLGAAWCLYVVSVLFGIVHIMALTGELAPTTPRELQGIGPFPRALALGQVMAFFAATFTILLYGMVALRYWNSLDRTDRPPHHVSAETAAE